MEYTPKKLKEITAIVEKYGTYRAVADFLKISDSTLYKRKKGNRKLEQALQDGLNKYIPKRECPYTEKQLDEIEKILQKGFLKDAAKYLNISAATFSNHCKQFLELNKILTNSFAEKKRIKTLPQEKVVLDCFLEKSKKKNVVLLENLPFEEYLKRMKIIERKNQEDALARYRKMKAAEKEAYLRKQVKNIEEII